MRPTATTACVAMTLAASAGILAQRTDADTSAKAMVAAASAYVEAYNAKMMYVLADEIATQRVTTARAGESRTRTTKSDFFMTFLPAESVWIAVRDVREVDGAAVDDPNNIRVLMDRAPLSKLGSVIAEKNSRYNIGSISRTFNEPTLPLLVVSAKHRDRFKFDRGSVTPGDRPKVSLSFKEKSRPTLITESNGAPVFTTGELLVDAETGRIEHTRLELVQGTVSAKIETTYVEDAKLRLWVPSVMRETYTQTARGFEEEIGCESTYTNYRKFETSAIIK